MTSSPRSTVRRLPAVLVATALALCVVGCRAYKPQPFDETSLQGRIDTQSRDGLTVSVAVLSRDESRSVFGVDLYDNEIQPIWVSIVNETEVPFWFMLHAVDPEYYSAREAAYKSHYLLRPWSNREMDDRFEGLGIVPMVPARGSTSGFVFSNVKLGTKEVRVQVIAEKQLERFHFYVSVPGFKADHSAFDWDALKKREDKVEVETEAELVALLENLPCCTSRENGTGKGDPLNLVVISPERGLTAFVRAGWDETELLTLSSAWRTFKAFFGGRYRYSPMSSLYFDGRPQSIGLQKARDTIHERNHLRLWGTNWRYKGDYILVGTITRDIGIYFTPRAWTLTTHAIDPMVDEARNYLLEDLLTAEAVQTFGAVEGVGEATKSEPHRNLMYAPWWTDGRRFVMHLAPIDRRVPLDSLELFEFHMPTDAHGELDGRHFEGHGSIEDAAPAAP